MKEGTVSEFIRDTLDPIGSHALLSQGAYHYLLVRAYSLSLLGLLV